MGNLKSSFFHQYRLKISRNMLENVEIRQKLPFNPKFLPKMGKKRGIDKKGTMVYRFTC
jgi:hypothetical protein